MKFTIYLSFDGHCREAFEFYRSVLGGEITAMLRFADGPAESCGGLSADIGERIMHGCYEVAGFALMATDATPEHPYAGVTGAHVALHAELPEQAERWFAALSAGGQVQMPIGPTFWALRYGMFVDRFGIPWMINCALPSTQAQCA